VHGHEQCDHVAAPPVSAPASAPATTPPPVNNSDVKRLGIVLSVGRCIGGLAALGWTIYAARELGADWGRLSTVLAYAAVAAVFTDLGIPLALTQLSCRHKQLDRSVVFHAMRRRAIVGSVAALALVFAWVNTSSAQGKWALAALYGISVTVNPVTGSFLALLRGRAIGTVEACYEAGRQLALPVIGIAIVEMGLGVFAVLAVYVIIDVVGAMLVYRTAQPKLGIIEEPKPDESEASELTLRQTVPLSSTVIVGNAYERVDSALLAPLAGLASVGVYRMISPIVGAALMPARGFGDAAAVGAGRTDKDNLRGFVTKFAVKGAMITVPVAIILAIIGPVILPKILSTHSSDPAHAINWNEAATPLRILFADRDTERHPGDTHTGSGDREPRSRLPLRDGCALREHRVEPRVGARVRARSRHQRRRTRFSHHRNRAVCRVVGDPAYGARGRRQTGGNRCRGERSRTRLTRNYAGAVISGSTCLCSTHAGHALEVVITILVVLVAIVSVAIAITRTRRLRRRSEAREH
jgi:hypothetical protein